jgi:hypothetical protein
VKGKWQGFSIELTMLPTSLLATAHLGVATDTAEEETVTPLTA